MSANDMFECVCQFFQQQSAALQNIMQGLGSQNTISDIGGGGDQLSLPNEGFMQNITPMQLFMFLLLAMWTYMFIFSRNAKAKHEKPARGPLPDGQGSGSSSSGGSGGAGGSGGITS